MFSIVPSTTIYRILKLTVVEGIFKHAMDLTQGDVFAVSSFKTNFIKPELNFPAAISLRSYPLEHFSYEMTPVWIHYNILNSSQSPIEITHWRHAWTPT